MALRVLWDTGIPLFGLQQADEDHNPFGTGRDNLGKGIFSGGVAALTEPTST